MYPFCSTKEVLRKMLLYLVYHVTGYKKSTINLKKVQSLFG